MTLSFHPCKVSYQIFLGCMKTWCQTLWFYYRIKKKWNCAIITWRIIYWAMYPLVSYYARMFSHVVGVLTSLICIIMQSYVMLCIHRLWGSHGTVYNVGELKGHMGEWTLLYRDDYRWETFKICWLKFDQISFISPDPTCSSFKLWPLLDNY